MWASLKAMKRWKKLNIIIDVIYSDAIKYLAISNEIDNDNKNN